MQSESQANGADLLRLSKSEILRQWEERAKAEIPAARMQNRLQLLDQLPHFLDELRDALRKSDQRGAVAENPVEQAVSKEHGEQRASMVGYGIEEVQKEYEILRDVIFHALETQKTLKSVERECILRSIFSGLRDAGKEFARKQLENERKYAESLRIERDLREKFVVTLTHDLRNPLSVIRSGASILMKRGDDVAMRQKILARLTSAIDHAEQMISELLDANQISVGKSLKLEIEEVELCSMLKDVLTEAATIHGDRFQFACTAPTFGYWCRSKLRRAVNNLLDNAAKYGSRYEKIDVKVSNRQAADEVELSVHNKGNPISQEIQLRIFEPFYRSEAAEATDKSGWGLGLPLVRGITEAHGGRVEVRSSEAEGTTFIITLPRDSRKLAKG